jgi:hypothetical protein
MSSDINVQTFSGKVNISNNLLVGSGHLFVDTQNNLVGLRTSDPQAGLHVESNTYVRDDFRVGSGIVMNETSGLITAGSFAGDGSGLDNLNTDSGSWVNGTSSNVHLATTGDSVGIGVTTVDSGIKLQVNGVVKATGFTGIQESDVPTLSAYATTSALATGLGTKQDSGSYATTSQLSTGLDTKQDSGSYATTSQLSTGLGTKQDSGSYATTSALSTGLATKQDSGSYATTSALSTGLGTKQDSGSYATTLELSTGLATKQASGDYAALAGSTTQAFSAVRVGMGATASASYKLYVKHDDTTADGGTTAAFIDANFSGSDTFSGSKTNRGLYIDVDSSATGGGTSNEHRLYGVYADVRHTGDSDLCYAGYFYARSDHTAGQCSALKGIYASAQDSANGTNSLVYAGEFKALKDSGSTNTTATMMGIRAEVEIDAGTITNAYGVHSHIDRDGGTITNGYLFHGTYAGSDTGVKWGIHLSGAEKNYLTGTLQVVGTVTAPTFDGNASTAGSATTLTTARNINGVSFNGSVNITVNGLKYNVNDSWLRYLSDGSYVKLYGNSRSMVFRTDGTTQYSSNGAYPFVWLYGGDATGNRRMLINTSGQLWMSNYGWLHDKFADKAGSTSQNFSSKECYVQNWVRTKGDAGHYWEGTSNGSGWHIYPRNRADMFMRTGAGNGGIAGTVGNDYPRGYVHWTTSNEIGFLNATRNWSLRMDNSNNCQVYGRMYASGSVSETMTARYYNSSGNNGNYTTTRAISVYALQMMRCSEMQVTSDRRIKTDIVDVDDGSALELLRKIQPKTYGYVDTLEKGTKHVYGFIAQEIKELIPEAVDVGEGDLPNIYKHATIDIQANSITIKDFDTSTLNQTDSIIYIDQDDKRQTLKIKSIINSTQLEIEEDLEKIVETFKTSKMEEYKFTGEIFIWGQQVNDFHHLQKSAIWTVATAALQEVDRQQQSDKARITTLETQLQAERARNDSLEARILALENK